MVFEVPSYFLDFVGGFFFILSPFAFIFFLRPLLESLEESLSDAAIRPGFGLFGLRLVDPGFGDQESLYIER